MLLVGKDLASYTLAAGEPFVLEVQLLDSAGRGIDLDDQAMVLTFYTAGTRALVNDYAGAPSQYEGERLSDTTGEYFRWAFDGRWSEAMLGKPGLRVELAQRLFYGRSIISTGTLSVVNSSAAVPSLAGGSIALTAVRVSIKANATLGGAPQITQTVILYDGPSVPVPAPVFTTPTSVASDGTPQVGELLTGIDGVATNAASYTRRWLLGSTLLTSSATYTPTSAGSYRYETIATGPGGETTSGSNITVAAAAPVLNALTISPSTATAGTSTTITISGATAGSVITGTVPAGMTLNSAARTITGTPTTAGSPSIVLTETLAGATGSPRQSTVGLTIAAAPVTPSLNALTVSPSSATVGTAYSGTINGLTSGSSIALTGAGAAGLSIAGAVITGTPTTVGAVNIVETLAGATGSPRTSSGVITVAAAAVVLNALTLSPSTATVGTAYTGTVSGKTSGSTLALSGAGAAGLTVSGSTVSGTPTTVGAVDVVETLAGATGSPRTSSGVLAVTTATVDNGVTLFTDFYNDVDDAAAMGVLLTETASQGKVISAAIADSKYAWSGPGLDALLKAYGNNAPVGTYKGTLGVTQSSSYSLAIRDRFGDGTKTKASYPDDTVVARTALAAAGNGTHKIITIGGLVGLARLYNSPADAISPLTGAELIALKVASIDIMGGDFSQGKSEANIKEDIPSSQVVAGIPSVPITWHDFRLGDTVYSRSPAWTNGLIDPIQTAFEHYGAESNGNLRAIGGGRSSWDPLTVFTALRGIAGRFTISEPGGVVIDSAGFTTHTANTGGNNHRYITGKLVTNAVLANELIASIGVSTKPIPATVKGVISDLSETTGRYYRDPDYYGAWLFAGGTYTSAVVPTRVAAPDASKQVLDFTTTTAVGVYADAKFFSPNYVWSVVVNPDANTAGTLMCLAGNASASGHNVSMVNGKLVATSWTGGTRTTPRVATSTVDLPIGVYSLVTLYNDGTTMSLRVNGAEVASIAAPNEFAGATAEMFPTFGAARSTSGALVDPMDGKMAAAGFWTVGSPTTLAMVETKLRSHATAKGITLP